MEISAEKVRELREKSGAGIMDCKRALKETHGDLPGALDFLRKEGVIKASQKVGRPTAEGLIGVANSPDGSRAALVEVNCETDFVARTDPFQELVKRVCRVALESSPPDVPALLCQRIEGQTVEETLKGLVARLGENMAIPRFAVVKADRNGGEIVSHYVHAGSRLGVLLKARGSRLTEADVRDVSMHVAAMHPAYIDRAAVPAERIAKEREILESSAELQGKPAPLKEKIIDGKLARFFGEICLLEQPFIKDPQGKQTVEAYLKAKDPEAKVVEMIRFHVGEHG